MTAFTSTLQSVSLSLNISRQADVEMPIRARLKPLIHAYQRIAKNVEAQVWTARVEGAYKLEQAKSACRSLFKHLTLTFALFLPLAMIWTGIIVVMHMRMH